MDNAIGLKIKSIREQKGISQEAMALELNATQSNYGRLEKNDNRLTVPKLMVIAKVLDVTISHLFDEKSGKVINQQNSENASAYFDNVFNADKDHIESLKKEIAFLREVVLAKEGKEG